MKNSFRQSMTWLHTWTGLILGWVAFAIFATGTTSYFKSEITRWMQPEIVGGGTPIDAAHLAVRLLEEKGAKSASWFINLPDGRERKVTAFYNAAGARRFQTETIDPTPGEKTAPRLTNGGEFFYRFHFQLQLPNPWGRYMAGIVALTLFIALLTGIVAHRRFFADLFLFRPGRIALRSWLDFHNVAGVLTLPFFLVITYSGLVIFHSLYLPWAGRILPRETEAAPRASTAKQNSAGTDSAEGRAPWISPAPVGPMIEEAARRWGTTGRTLNRIQASHRGSSGATVTLTRAEGPEVSLRALEQLKFDGVSGKLISDGRASEGDRVARGIHGILYGLHIARFANPFVRALLFSLGLLGTALIASGLVMWTIKRRPKLVTASPGSRFSFGLVERLNVTAIAGFFVASAVIFWANRLLPLDLPERNLREADCFLFAWGAMLLHACFRPSAAAWREQLLTAAALFISLPALDGAVAGEHLTRAARTFDLAYLGVEIAFVVLGLGLAVAAGKVTRRLEKVVTADPKMSSQPTMEAPQEVRL